MLFEEKNVILFLLEQGAIGCYGRHRVKIKFFHQEICAYVFTTSRAHFVRVKGRTDIVIRIVDGITFQWTETFFFFCDILHSHFKTEYAIIVTKSIIQIL